MLISTIVYFLNCLLPSNESGGGKKWGKVQCWHHPNILRNPGQSRTFFCALIILLSPKLNQVFDSLTSLRWKKKNPEMSQIPTRKPYIFTWLIFFLKEPNQSHLFCDIIITASSVGPHWLALIILLELLDHLLFLFILLWTNRRIISYLSLILPLTIAITQWLIHWRCSINDS